MKKRTYNNNNVLFASGLLGLIIIHVYIIYSFGYPLHIALWDSAISNLLLAAFCWMMIRVMRFYVPEKNRYPVIIGWSLFVAGSWHTLLQFILPQLSFGDEAYSTFFKNSLLTRFWITFLIVSWVAIVNMLWYRQKEDQLNQKRQEETNRISREAELFKLRQQLQPHFLFNSLNSISALVKRNPDEARNMIMHLSDFLRGTLKQEDHTMIPFSEELNQLKLYMAIEEVRFGHRLKVEFDIEEETAKLLAPSMIAQPLVENAVKYGLYDTTGDAAIRISSKSNNGFLEISVQNPFDSSTSKSIAGTGFGLKSVSRRLYLLFGRTDLLHTNANETTFTTTVKIPQHAQGSDHR